MDTGPVMPSGPDLPAQLAGLGTPAPRADALKSEIRLALLDARASSRVGFVLIALPAAFVFGVILHYGFQLPVPGFATLESGLEWIEHQRYIPYLSPLLLVGAPLVAFCLNALALMHFRVDRTRRELLFTLKLRPVNLAIMVMAAFVIALVFAHALAERAHHLA